MPRNLTVWDWVLVALAVAVAGGMALTLWAGATGRVRSVHGVQGAVSCPRLLAELPTRRGDVYPLVGAAPQADALGVAQLG